MTPVTVFAPAKINLGLRITGRYANGYHRLETVFAPISIYDRLTFQGAPIDSVRHIWPQSASIADRRALSLGTTKNPLLQKIIDFMRIDLSETQDRILPQISVHLEKQIPSPAGLGGASADAAALIKAISKWHTHTQKNEPYTFEFLKRVASLGADIPFFLQYGLTGSPAILRGIGHELAPVGLPQLSGFIVVPPFGFSTAKMFAHVRILNMPVAEEEPPAPKTNLALRLNEIPFSDELAGRVKIVQNDFDAVAQAVFPAESKLLAGAKTIIALTLKQFLPESWIMGMTGSGAGLFAATEANCGPERRAAMVSALRFRLGGAWSVIPFTTLENIGP